MVLKDLQAWYGDWLDSINDASAGHDTAQVYKRLQRLGRRKKDLGKGPRALPRLRKADGQCAHSFEECQAIWKEQFARTEAGVEVTDIQLAQLHAQGDPTARRDARFCPDPYEVLSIIPQVQKREGASARAITSRYSQERRDLYGQDPHTTIL